MSRKRGESRTGALVDDKNKKSDGRREKRRAKVGRSSRGEKIKCAEEEAHEVKKEEEGREKESEKRRIEIKGLGGGGEKFRGKSLHGSYPLSRRVGRKC